MKTVTLMVLIGVAVAADSPKVDNLNLDESLKTQVNEIQNKFFKAEKSKEVAIKQLDEFVAKAAAEMDKIHGVATAFCKSKGLEFNQFSVSCVAPPKIQAPASKPEDVASKEK